MSSVDQQSPRVSRRNLALGAAWAAPVIALGAPAPAQAVTNSACDPATGTFNFSWDIFNSATSAVARSTVWGSMLCPWA